MIRDDIISHLIAERRYQDQKWGGPEHDDEHDPDQWVCFIREYAEGTNRRTCKHPFPTRMVKCGALALAAIERIDRDRQETPSQPESIINEASDIPITDELKLTTPFTTLTKILIRHAGDGNESPKDHRRNMLTVLAYCIHVLNMLGEAALWPVSTEKSTSSK